MNDFRKTQEFADYEKMRLDAKNNTPEHQDRMKNLQKTIQGLQGEAADFLSDIYRLQRQGMKHAPDVLKFQDAHMDIMDELIFARAALKRLEVLQNAKAIDEKGLSAMERTIDLKKQFDEEALASAETADEAIIVPAALAS